jgi:hypothetical protein
VLTPAIPARAVVWPGSRGPNLPLSVGRDEMLKPFGTGNVLSRVRWMGIGFRLLFVTGVELGIVLKNDDDRIWGGKSPSKSLFRNPREGG